jgi:hypothetical protein
MSLWFYGIIFFAVVLGVLLVLVIFSCLAMAQKADEYQDQLEYALRQGHLFSPHQANSETSVNSGSSPDSDLEKVDNAETGILISR